MSSSALSRTIARQAREAGRTAIAYTRKRPGPAPLPVGDTRRHTVSVRMNRDELAELDDQRTAATGAGEASVQRGEHLRLAWLGETLAAQIPSTNREAWAALARSSANLTQISAHLASKLGEDVSRDLRGSLAAAGLELDAFRLELLRTDETPASRSALVQVRRVMEAHSREERRARRGPNRLPEGERRDHVVAVRLNVAELDNLDRQRGSSKRGEFLRMAWVALQADGRVHQLDSSAYSALSNSARNLNSIAHYLNEQGDLLGRQQLIEQEVAAFRRNLKRAGA
jgi:hypothetical protein